LTAFTLLYFYLWRVRCDLERTQETVETLEREVQARLREAS
jgi:hypothetical protein